MEKIENTQPTESSEPIVSSFSSSGKSGKFGKAKQPKIIVGIVAGIVIVIATILLASKPVSSPPAGTPIEPHATITITAAGFEPRLLQVEPGTVIVWKNNDSSVHKVASDPFPEATEHPDLNSKGAINTGDSYSYRVTKEGIYNYNDPLHPERGGRIVVATPQ